MVETAYVFIHLPGQSKATVAGRFELNADTSPQVGEFVYGESYLANAAALPLDPIALPLKEQLFKTTLSSGFFGVFRDAIPDDWGRHVASKLYGSRFKTLFDCLIPQVRAGAGPLDGNRGSGSATALPAHGLQCAHLGD